MLRRNKFVREPKNTISTTLFESIKLDIHINEMLIPFNYENFVYIKRTINS